jgi:ADP-ribose pyrophosphatase YjhB (NUDIX family)
LCFISACDEDRKCHKITVATAVLDVCGDCLDVFHNLSLLNDTEAHNACVQSFKWPDYSATLSIESIAGITTAAVIGALVIATVSILSSKELIRRAQVAKAKKKDKPPTSVPLSTIGAAPVAGVPLVVPPAAAPVKRPSDKGAGVVPFTRKDDQVLLLMHKTSSGKKIGKLVDFGGRPEKGEKPEETAARELREETNGKIEVDASKLKGSTSVTNNGYQTYFVEVPYVDTTEIAESSAAGAKKREYVWVPLSSVLDGKTDAPLFERMSAAKEFLTKLRELKNPTPTP